MKKSFFEYLGMADMEKMHSQVLSWLFSKNCNAITEVSKLELLNSIFDIGVDFKNIETTQTEINGIDILISTENHVIIVENKLKTFQHSFQLERYKDYAERRFEGHKISYFYLTLIPEKIKNKEWHRLSYSTILSEINKIRIEENTHGVILKEYLIYLERLVHISEEFIAKFQDYDLVFTDGKKRKEDKVNQIYTNEQIEFIAKNQLETIFQKFYLNKLADNLKHKDFFITDTRGDALINLHLKHNLKLGGNNYTTFIQFQGNLIKFAFAIEGEKYSTSKKEWIEDVIDWMQKLTKSELNRFKFTNLNKPKSKAYVSISRKITEKYWKLSIEQICQELTAAIETGEALTEQLLEISNGKISDNKSG